MIHPVMSCEQDTVGSHFLNDQSWRQPSSKLQAFVHAAVWGSLLSVLWVVVPQDNSGCPGDTPVVGVGPSGSSAAGSYAAHAHHCWGLGTVRKGPPRDSTGL